MALSSVSEALCELGFSPLHEGDTSVARLWPRNRLAWICFSPLHEGDTSVAAAAMVESAHRKRFSPLHEGDTSVAMKAGTHGRRNRQFQSPSRGGHLCGPTNRPRGTYLEDVSVPFTRGTPLWRRSAQPGRCQSGVSVPFTRGTPLWRSITEAELLRGTSFSPLHEGDTSVAVDCVCGGSNHGKFQSPSRGGHLCGQVACRPVRPYLTVSVPFTRGTPLWLRIDASRRYSYPVSVPFTRGTPLWQSLPSVTQRTGLGFSPLHEGDTSVATSGSCVAGASAPFQSPSRGGHLCGFCEASHPRCRDNVSVPFTRGTPLWRISRMLRFSLVCGFSPLHEGDTSVAAICGRRSGLVHSFSPLHEGDTSVATDEVSTPASATKFQSPSRGGHLCGAERNSSGVSAAEVSVPFTRGTPLWRRAQWRRAWRRT